MREKGIKERDKNEQGLKEWFFVHACKKRVYHTTTPPCSPKWILLLHTTHTRIHNVLIHKPYHCSSHSMLMVHFLWISTHIQHMTRLFIRITTSRLSHLLSNMEYSSLMIIIIMHNTSTTHMVLIGL